MSMARGSSAVCAAASRHSDDLPKFGRPPANHAETDVVSGARLVADAHEVMAGQAARQAAHAAHVFLAAQRVQHGAGLLHHGVGLLVDGVADAAQQVLHADFRLQGAVQIGRASCRERVSSPV